MYMSVFSEWFRGKYLDWEKENTGNIQGLTKFSEYLEVPQSMASAWMAGRYKPGAKYLPNLAAKLGEDVYRVLYLPLPFSKESELDILPPAYKSAFLAARSEAVAELDKRGIANDSPEGKEIIRAAFSRHGVEIKVV